MTFTHDTQQFYTVAQWLINLAVLDLLPETKIENEYLSLRKFFLNLYTAMCDRSKEFGLPTDKYEPYFETNNGKDQNLQERIQEQRLRARKAVDNGILSFIYQIGQKGQPAGDALQMERHEFQQITGDIGKHLNNVNIIPEFERIGLTFEINEMVLTRSPSYPGILQALSTLSKECARLGKDGFYFFRRCDIGVVTGKYQPTLNDAINYAPLMARNELARTDSVLISRKFKREILVTPDVTGGYRLRYSKKGGQLILWCRIGNWFYPPFYQHLRWDLGSHITPRLFTRLEQLKPGLPGRIIGNLRTCTHCYQNCAAMAKIDLEGISYEVCNEHGWGDIGASTEETDDLLMVIEIIDGILSEKKR